MQTLSAKQAGFVAVINSPGISVSLFLTCTEATVGPRGDTGIRWL